AVVMTASPGCTPQAISASHKASVPELQPTAALAPVKAAISDSRASTSLPRMNCCEAHTRSTAANTSSRICSYWRCRSSRGTESTGFVADGLAVEEWGTDG